MFPQHKSMTINGVTDFDLAQTLGCGQCFRWVENADGSYTGVVGKQVLTVRQMGHTLICDGVQGPEARQAVVHYFDLDTDYGKIKRELSQNPVFEKAIRFAPGIHVLRQDGWETLCSFIISQSNHIKRISGIIQRLCALLGQPLGGGHFAFPTPEALARCTLEDLEPVRCGFRAKYLIDAARKVTSGQVDLDSLYTLDIEAAREELMKIYGVGIKVADCVLLFGFERVECFPADVWIKRAMAALFPQGLPSEVAPYAGIAQQYLYHYVRLCPEVLVELGEGLQPV